MSPSWLHTDALNQAGSILKIDPGFLQLGLTQHVHYPTHVRSHGDSALGSTLDLILSTSSATVANHVVLPPLGKSDHCVVKAELPLHSTKRP